jgi:hypothetical protein
MSNRLLPLNDTDFWWLRYVLGVAVPAALTAWGVYSIVTLHSYAIGRMGRGIQFIPVKGEQAILMGVAYIGVAVMLFSNCYAQYHESMGFYYQWLLASGALMTTVGVLWCSWLFLYN